ncbi:MAG TPA: DsbA family protein [Gemmatimonadaceae bacterium]
MNDVRRGGPGRGFWVALGVIALVGIGALVWLTSRPKTQVTRIDPSLPPLKAEGYLLGSPTAPVEVIEFADFECPACGQFAAITEPDVRTALVNTGKVRIRYMDFPLPMHKNTWDASLAAACANDQGKFWQMHDAIFQNQDRWNTEATSRPRGPLGDLAKAIGLDMTKYGACMDSEVHRPMIQATQAEAQRRNVQSTPTFVFNGTMVSSALPYDVFKRYADEAAARAPATAAPAATTDSSHAASSHSASAAGKRP